MSSQTVCVCVWGGDLKRQKCFPVPCSTLPYNHSMEICPIWKYGARSADAETPPGLLGQKQEQESLGHQNQNRQIYQLKAISCVCFPVVFLFQSWGAVCLLRVAIWFEKSYVCTESGYIIPTGGNLRECMFFITSCEKLCCKHRSASKWSCLPSFAPSITGSANQKDRLVF